jgi:hypothetical protein
LVADAAVKLFVQAGPERAALAWLSLDMGSESLARRTRYVSPAAVEADFVGAAPGALLLEGRGGPAAEREQHQRCGYDHCDF